jgi:Helix-turn-helix domain
MDLSTRISLDDEQLHLLALRVADLLAERPAEDGYLNAAAAAAYLDCTPRRIHDLVQLGKLQPRHDGRRLLFARSDLRRYVEEGS